MTKHDLLIISDNLLRKNLSGNKFHAISSLISGNSYELSAFKYGAEFMSKDDKKDFLFMLKHLEEVVSCELSCEVALVNFKNYQSLQFNFKGE